jgi:hypothetical protein
MVAFIAAKWLTKRHRKMAESREVGCTRGRSTSSGRVGSVGSHGANRIDRDARALSKARGARAWSQSAQLGCAEPSKARGARTRADFNRCAQGWITRGLTRSLAQSPGLGIGSMGSST